MSTPRQLRFRSEAREKVLRGATTLADAVRATLGPKARCVLIERRWGKPLVSNDGVTIAKEVALVDPDENLGAQVLREAAERPARGGDHRPDQGGSRGPRERCVRRGDAPARRGDAHRGARRE